MSLLTVFSLPHVGSSGIISYRRAVHPVPWATKSLVGARLSMSATLGPKACILSAMLIKRNYAASFWTRSLPPVFLAKMRQVLILKSVQSASWCVMVSLFISWPGLCSIIIFGCSKANMATMFVV